MKRGNLLLDSRGRKKENKNLNMKAQDFTLYLIIAPFHFFFKKSNLSQFVKFEYKQLEITHWLWTFLVLLSSFFLKVIFTKICGYRVAEHFYGKSLRFIYFFGSYSSEALYNFILFLFSINMSWNCKKKFTIISIHSKSFWVLHIGLYSWD